MGIVLQRVRTLNSRFGPALVGQGLNFAAMLLPVVAKQPGMVAYMLFPVSLGMIVSRSMSLSYHSVYLQLPDNRLSLSTAASGFMALVGTGLLGVVGVALLWIHPAWAARVLWAMVATVSITLYNMYVAITIREDRMGVYSRVRFIYGVVNIVATGGVVFVFPVREGLIYVAALNYVCAAVLLARAADQQVWSAIRREWSSLVAFPSVLAAPLRSYIRENKAATSGAFFADIGFQIQGMVTPMLGAYANTWAIVVRLYGGFLTLAQQVVAPSFEAPASKAIRQGDPDGYRVHVRRAAIVAGVLGAGTAVVQYGAIVWNDGSYWAAGYIPLFVALSLYVTAGVVSAMLTKYPVVVGRQRGYMVWTGCRALFFVLVPLFFRGGPVVYLFCVIMTVSIVALPYLCSPRVARGRHARV
ncbi:hypothetical protein ACGE24_06250 [Corynebacterium kroppenstedtii]|uniref:hypothetical protein n=1 Tax=Corynebacterium sp. PCR 32 TaxID=3351342 RepID=UPI0030A5C801